MRYRPTERERERVVNRFPYKVRILLRYRRGVCHNSRRSYSTNEDKPTMWLGRLTTPLDVTNCIIFVGIDFVTKHY